VWIWWIARSNNHSMIGTSVWVRARLGNWSGATVKKQKAKRASDVRSQAPEPFWTKACRLPSGERRSVDWEAKGEATRCKLVVVLVELGQFCKAAQGLPKPQGNL